MPHTDPLPDSLFHVKGFPETLALYKIESSSFWQCRVFVGRKLVRRSTKTESRSQAIEFAKDLFHELLIKARRGEPLVEPKADFETVANDMLAEDQKLVDRGDRQQSLVDDSKRILKADMMDFFKGYRCRDIDFKKVQAYRDHLGQRKDKKGKLRPPISSATLRIHFVVLKKILKHAQAMGLLTAMPIFPRVSVQVRPRGWLDTDEYQTLIKTMREEIKSGTRVRYQPITERLIDVTEFMVNSFLRPGDLKLMQHKHVKVIREPNLYLRITAFNKKVATQVVTTSTAAYIYETRLKPKDVDPQSYVFYPEMDRTAAMELMSRQFSHVLAKAGLKESLDGQERTLYSLRHTCCMIQYTAGWDPAVIAANMRTSPEMIHKYYGSHLKAEMLVGEMAPGLEERASIGEFFESDEAETP